MQNKMQLKLQTFQAQHYQIQEPNHKQNSAEFLNDYKHNINEYYCELYSELNKNIDKHQIIDDIKQIKQFKVQHNTCFIVGRSVTWKLSELLKQLECTRIPNKYENHGKIAWTHGFSTQNNLTLRAIKLFDKTKPASKQGNFIILHFLDIKKLDNKQKCDLLKDQSKENRVNSYQVGNIKNYSNKPEVEKRSKVEKYQSKLNKKNSQQTNQIQGKSQQKQDDSQVQKNLKHHQHFPPQKTKQKIDNNLKKQTDSSQHKLDTKFEESHSQNQINDDQKNANKLKGTHESFTKVNFVKEEYVDLSDKEKIELLQIQLEKQVQQEKLQQQIYQYKLIQQQKEIIKLKEEQYFLQNPGFNPNGLFEKNPIKLD